ncbi:MAG TPA: hypothetical protein VKL22_03050, partial [Actinomycetota bacterium]|nr:hypothetical protein [Actinomycetota bacterium]
LVGAAGTGGTALAASPSRSPNQIFFVAARVEDPTAGVFALGAINGIGTLTAESADFHQESDSFVETDRVVVGGGTLHVTVHGRFSAWPFTLDPVTCTRWGGLTGTWTLDSGEGPFAGATGSGTFGGHFFTYAAHMPGGCDESAIKGFSVGPLIGTVNLPG